MSKLAALSGAFLACALIAPAAMAQTAAPREAAPATTATAPATGQWRASKLIGVNVYNRDNEKLGEVTELIIEPSGRVAGAIIGVGGFLGVGQHDILVALDKLSFQNESGRATTGTSASDSKRWYPDRAVLNASKDQLKAMPQFKY